MTDDPTTDSKRFVDVVGSRIGENLERLFGKVTASDVFRTLETSEDRVVIGASAVERAGGFGFGAGEGVDPDADEVVGGGGGGGGGAGQARPVAVIEITPDGVKVWPVIDYTKLGLVAIGVLAAIWKIRR